MLFGKILDADQRQRGAGGIFRADAGAGRQRAGEEFHAGINFRPRVVELVIPRQNIFEEKPGAHRVREFKSGQRQHGLQFLQRLPGLFPVRPRLVCRREPADKALPRAAFGEHRAADATMPFDPFNRAGEGVNLDAGDRFAGAIRAFHPRHRPVHATKVFFNASIPDATESA